MKNTFLIAPICHSTDYHICPLTDNLSFGKFLRPVKHIGKKMISCSTKPCILLLLKTLLINSIMNRHSCKILFSKYVISLIISYSTFNISCSFQSCVPKQCFIQPCTGPGSSAGRGHRFNPGPQHTKVVKNGTS